jgi:rubrerythrin
LSCATEKEEKPMSSKDELVEFLKEQVKVENKIVESLNKSLPEIDNPTVKGVLKGVSLDSVKHAEMYASAVRLMTTVSKALTQENLDKQKDLVERHIEMEARLIRKISEVLPTVKDNKVRLLLSAILEDEKRHHGLLKQILEVLVKGETITEADWWDILWKDVPFHGSPGG